MNEEERKGRLIRKIRGGVRIGKSYVHSSNLSWPFVKLEIYNDELIINSFLFNIKIKKMRSIQSNITKDY